MFHVKVTICDQEGKIALWELSGKWDNNVYYQSIQDIVSQPAPQLDYIIYNPANVIITPPVERLENRTQINVQAVHLIKNYLVQNSIRLFIATLPQKHPTRDYMGKIAMEQNLQGFLRFTTDVDNAFKMIHEDMKNSG